MNRWLKIRDDDVGVLAVGSDIYFPQLQHLPGNQYRILSGNIHLNLGAVVWPFFGSQIVFRYGDALEGGCEIITQTGPSNSYSEFRIQNSEFTEDVDIEELKEGDVVLVKPGEKVPADGIIIKGAVSFNESHISKW